MTATSLQVITLDIANPDWADPDYNPNRINSSISFQYIDPYGLTTLSSRDAPSGADLTGLLYTPTLPDSASACINASAPYVPTNVTRRSNLPEVNYDMVGLAPWLSPECVQAYLAAASGDTVRGFLFFLPDNGTQAPPDADSSTWSLGDHGDWRRETPFPVYAVAGETGSRLMHQSALYSGNITQVPYGAQLAEIYHPWDYARLFVDINTSGGSRLPSLWVFLLVVLAILFVVIAATSLSMHWLQRRRRRALRDRVATGEVDLEALGIKRLTVPQSLLDKMPLYTYGSGMPVQQNSLAREITSTTAAPGKLTSIDSSRPSSPDPNVRPSAAMACSESYQPSPLQQPTCAICLDDFVAASPDTQGTIVRQLPCHHIFHPECVDTFLKESSSLCPICKRTALPKGYCPQNVTNAMVRRERMVRRLRPDAEADAPSSTGALPEATETPSRLTRLSTSLGRRISSAPVRRSQQMTELTRSNSTAAAASARPTQIGVQPADTPTRREWARHRAEQMLGRRTAPLDPDEEEARETPGWKKALKGVFPGFGRESRRSEVRGEGNG